MEWAPNADLKNLATYAIKYVTLGNSVKLTCPVDAKPDPEFSWAHGDQDSVPKSELVF